MNDNIRDIIRKISICDADEKRKLFDHLRENISFHKLEQEFGIRAERILDAISRGSDLTKRGVRGVIAETVFATEIAPNTPGWSAYDPAGDEAYDVLMVQGLHQIRVQVKMQRRERGVPLMRSPLRGGQKDHFVVEVQRTRNGRSGEGVSTRPYSFSEFDVLAVCMEPSERQWHSFLYIPTYALQSRPFAPSLIAIMQLVPQFPALYSSNWTADLSVALNGVIDMRKKSSGIF
ncbi:hypothetical protein [Azospirillum sp. Sh1]|uniref:hypothetical protein n=1 Tax=Azospirillum sp. Sh1 TaxID=2607285 RepID=UPI0011ECDF22|nr:hypothetical protein [Azospirillum sp. Sh1]KAA0570902.1 hypothetical protein FZ029_28805 [Azospirillum sp. Sh1]